MKQHAGKLVRFPPRAPSLERREENEAQPGDVIAFDSFSRSSSHPNLRFVRFYLHRFYRTKHPQLYERQVELVRKCLAPLEATGTANWKSNHIDLHVDAIATQTGYEGLSRIYGVKGAGKLERWIKRRFTWMLGSTLNLKSAPRQKNERDFLVHLALLLAVFLLNPADVSALPKENVGL